MAKKIIFFTHFLSCRSENDIKRMRMFCGPNTFIMFFLYDYDKISTYYMHRNLLSCVRGQTGGV